MRKPKTRMPTPLQILAGAEFGRPVWLGTKLVCSRCLGILSARRFGPGQDLRVEPVCAECRQGASDQ
ncbi:MAG: hypothetical protein V2A79_09850 [Planctomycetota bacterium]